MIRPSHISQLLTYAAEELRIMVECGHHLEVSGLASEILDSSSQIKAHVERAAHLRAADIMNTAAAMAAAVYGADLSKLSSANTPEERQARNAAIIIAGETGMCRAAHVGSRFGISSDTVTRIQSGLKAESFDRSDIRFIRAKRMAMQNLLSSGDGEMLDLLGNPAEVVREEYW